MFVREILLTIQSWEVNVYFDSNDDVTPAEMPSRSLVTGFYYIMLIPVESTVLGILFSRFAWSTIAPTSFCSRII